MLGRESGVDAKELPEARQEQPRADEEDERQRDLRDDERPAHSPGAASRRARSAVFSQHDAQVEAGDVHRRHGADDHAERSRHDRG